MHGIDEPFPGLTSVANEKSNALTTPKLQEENVCDACVATTR
jgi:hypothetical protein